MHESERQGRQENYTIELFILVGRGAPAQLHSEASAFMDSIYFVKKVDVL